jgi:hypothetical protein
VANVPTGTGSRLGGGLTGGGWVEGLPVSEGMVWHGNSLRGLLQRLEFQVFRGRKLIGISKDAQRVTCGGQIVEALIFQREFEEHVAHGQPGNKSKEAGGGSENPGSDKRRHQSESAHPDTEHEQQRAHPLNHEVLNPGVTNFVTQQHVNRFGDSDQIAEGAVLVSEDEHFVRHK